MFSLVMNHKTVADCWKMLKTHLSPRKSYNSQSIRDQLRNLEKTDAELITYFIIKVRALIDCL